MADRFGTILGTTLILVMAAGPAMAGVAVRLPEPATLSLFGLGAAGAFIAKRFIRRK
jgi:hypothetical protein